MIYKNFSICQQNLKIFLIKLTKKIATDIFALMKSFFKTIGYNEYENILSALKILTSQKKVPAFNSLNYVTSEDIHSPENIPGFNRSTVDGYAVLSKDTEGASPSIPALLEIEGEIKMGEKPFCKKLKKGKTIKVSTGGALPEGADAVVMYEYTQEIGNTLEIYRPVASGENVIKEDEDIKKGELIVKKGSILRVQEVQAILSSGITEVNVFSKPKIAIISTGDEIVPPGPKKSKFKIRDTNSFVLSSFLKRDGESPEFLGIIKDKKEDLFNSIEKNYNKFDVFLISGGSSMGVRDITEETLKEFGEILFHGIRVSPGKPLIFAKGNKKIFLGLPGHPVSSFISYFTIVKPLIIKIQGGNDYRIKPDGFVTLKRNVASKQGRESFIPVKLEYNNKNIIAAPILGESGLISIIKISDGFIRIPETREGAYRGEEIEFYRI